MSKSKIKQFPILALPLLLAGCVGSLSSEVPLPAQPTIKTESAAITLEKYKQTREGMTESQIVDILGKGYKVAGESRDHTVNRVLDWKNPDGSTVEVVFVDGKAVSISQNGLKQG